MANADCIVIQGSNMAEAHPVGFQWVMEAKKRGARVIHVDPRFTRTSANADRHLALRGGTDIALLGGVIRYILENDLWFEEYVKLFTNASSLVGEEYGDPEDLEGLFSGYDPETATYDDGTWAYAGDPEHLARGLPERDETLRHPRTVFQVLRRHYARYTPEMVQETCGISAEEFEYLASSIVENSGRERTTCFAYALGWTQHVGGAQMIRTAGVLQLLLGNVGRPGGGVMALRGHATIQGSTDIPTLYHILPGYLPMPKVGQDDFREYARLIGKSEQKGFWADSEVYAVNLLKAWWGEAATPENDFLYDYLPRLTGAHGTYQTVMRMLEDGVDGFFLFGQNPAVGSANGRMQRLAMSHLKWMVVRDFSLIESATWWKDGPEIESGELRSEDIATEMFFLPAANHTEKSGSFTQTQRLVQWRDKAVDPPGDAQSDLQFAVELGLRVRERLADSTDPRDRPILDLTWDYPADEDGEVEAEAVLAEINGHHLRGERAGQPLNGFAEMESDGSTAGGCWIYSGVYADGVNQARRRTPGAEQDEIAAEWGWAWPANRRILYNRASADAEGRPWSERKKLVWWDEARGAWTGHDIPDFPVTKRPDDPGDPTRGGVAALAGTDAFTMQADGRGWLFAPSGMVDGPLPTHYEGPESTVPNPLYPVQANPTRVTFTDPNNLQSPGATSPLGQVYPHVFTTYRITEHHTAGGMSRFLPYLSELQPEMYVEVSPELAEEVGLVPYGWATIISARSAIEAKVLITRRMKPLRIGGRTLHQVGMPFHFGRGTDAVVEGDSANDLIGMMLDANTQIQNSKNNDCAIIPGRRPRGAARLDLVAEYRRRAGLVPEQDAPVDGGLGAPGPGPAQEHSAHQMRGPEEASAMPTGESSIKEMRNR
ncbi:formate dehydrogenase major subunit [Brachybacterium sacelli]|uniref:Formate dehydrogenase major subunit n=3 Tax=Brachybacterium sacelli TaxID=173364 RepID=A0ABS4X0T1_9MICO|nr:formate dehydrogenase major subunit [Brachybacterium sacelli]